MLDRAPEFGDADHIDLSRWINRCDHVWCGQGAAEPVSLTGALVTQASRIGDLTAFVGMLFSNTFTNAQRNGLALCGYGGIGTARKLVEDGHMQVVPCHYSQLAGLVSQGRLRCDVVMLQLSPTGPDGRHSLGIAHDYLAILARHARVVIAEINDQVPWTFGSGAALDDIRIAARVHVSRPLIEVKGGAIGEVERRIADFAAPYVEDRCVLQPGVGTIPDAVLERLGSHKELGIHAGLIGDGVRKLMQSGAVTNSHKEFDAGKTTTGLAFGSSDLYRFIDRNEAIVLRDPNTTHAAASLRRLSRLVAINSAVEVDLTGQINAELAGSAYVGAVGGQVDFVRAALESRGGRSIIALPASTKNGRSRIVASLSGGVVTTPRSDADLVITEWGVAELRGQPTKERMRRLLAIAAPEHREELARLADQTPF